VIDFKLERISHLLIWKG